MLQPLTSLTLPLPPGLNATGCLAASWILQLGLSLCTTLVSTSLAWWVATMPTPLPPVRSPRTPSPAIRRCYVIFQRNRRVGLAIAIGLTIHLGMSIFAALGQAKVSISKSQQMTCRF